MSRIKPKWLKRQRKKPNSTPYNVAPTPSFLIHCHHHQPSPTLFLNAWIIAILFYLISLPRVFIPLETLFSSWCSQLKTNTKWLLKDKAQYKHFKDCHNLTLLFLPILFLKSPLHDTIDSAKAVYSLYPNTRKNETRSHYLLHHEKYKIWIKENI